MLLERLSRPHSANITKVSGRLAQKEVCLPDVVLRERVDQVLYDLEAIENLRDLLATIAACA